MNPPAVPPPPSALEKLSPPTQWAMLIAGSAVLAALFSITHLPAALMLGPMVAGIVLSSNGASIRAPRPAIIASQTIVGCLVARALTGDIAPAFAKDWPLLLGSVLVMVAASGLVGWLLARFDVLPGTTAVWGVAPGGASVMMVMSGAFGADPRLVAFMQYLRVVLVAALATVVARLWVGSAVTGPDVVWFAAFSPLQFLLTLLIAGLGGALGHMLRIPAGALLVPMVAGTAMEAAGLVHIILPPWLLAMSYAFLGWSVGLGFTRAILLHASRTLPQVLGAIMSVIGVSALLAWLLVMGAGIDPLTAYLATSPGGVDSVAIIAASSGANLSFVMSLQTARLVVVLIAGPPLARFIAQRMRQPAK